MGVMVVRMGATATAAAAATTVRSVTMAVVVVLFVMAMCASSAHSLNSICSYGDDDDASPNNGPEDADAAAAEEAEAEDLDRFIHLNSMPSAGKHAGSFTKVPELGSREDCVVMCCQLETCDVVFFFNGTCYLIRCNVSLPGGCDPVSRPTLNATMVTVREMAYRPAAAKPALPDAGSGEDRDLTAGASVLGARAGQSCEYGLKQCPQGEECVLQGSRSRHGLCGCVPGFERNADGDCQPQLLFSTTTPASGDSNPDGAEQEDQTDKTTPQPETPKVTKLTVSAGENKVLQLPENSITLSAYVFPNAKEDEEYHYEWSPMGQPEGSEERATMQGKNTNTLKLSNLIAGLYQMKVQVTGENKFGQAFVNITVLPPKRKNKAPIAVITPASQEVKSENSFILDGSDSTDDDGITSYHWEEVSGPLQEHQIDGDTQILKLKDMAPGFYVFRLTVTDTDGATNSTSANVTVIKETDYPPKANAGSDVVIYLPKKSVTLCGNASTDDKGIAQYEWIKKSDSLTADMTGVRTVCLQLNNLEKGEYTFTLKVTDTGGNTNTADVHVYVKPETNQPPVAHTAGELNVMLPSENIVLDGKGSTDDKGVVGYKWTQTGGPHSLTLSNMDQAVAVVTGDIVPGDYEFKLTVSDEEGQTASDKLTVHVKMSKNRPPEAKAGGDRVVLLPVSMVSLDGSASSDDRGIASYLWERDLESLAAGDVVNHSDHQAVLQLVNMVAGRYVFTLTVTDQDGLSSQDTASLLVKNGENYKDLVEMVLDTDIHHFSQDDKTNIVKQLELLIHQSTQHSGTVVEVQSTQLELTKGQLRLTFFVRKKDGSTVSGVDMVQLLTRKLDDDLILSFPITYLDTVLCQNNCSGHGQCDQRTKTCHCEAFWMPNVFKATHIRRSNCEWSILYVVIVCFIVIVGAIAGVWGVICCCRSKRCRIKTRKRHRYSLLREVEDDDDKNKLELMPKNKIQNSSVMISESDFSSEEETLFVNSKPLNGHSKPPNGIVARQHFRTKPKA
ncbi:dyslexia-associated protein KIAA0319-like protein [Babylonia areolata]|uniref:dyslexia-associated protein KIAA0319-like protein n=1 Tax=Babylonia areolata TaxID=304850 RepID=UPI003FD046BD